MRWFLVALLVYICQQKCLWALLMFMLDNLTFLRKRLFNYYHTFFYFSQHCSIIFKHNLFKHPIYKLFKIEFQIDYVQYSSPAHTRCLQCLQFSSHVPSCLHLGHILFWGFFLVLLSLREPLSIFDDILLFLLLDLWVYTNLDCWSNLMYCMHLSCPIL